MNRASFYNHLRPHVNLITTNVSGLEKVLDYAEGRGTGLQSLAYILATAWWETAQTMQPVREAFWLSEDWRKRNLRYYPYYGRGYVQLTWETNYRKAAEMVGLASETFVNNPNLVMDPKHALPILFKGMETGIFTSKKLFDYVDDIDESDIEDSREFRAARRVVNGTDKAATIATLVVHFEYALKAGKYGEKKEVPEIVPQTPARHFYIEGANVAVNDVGITMVWNKITEK